MNGISNAFRAVQNYIGLFMRSMFNVKGLFSIACISLLVAASSQFSGLGGDILNAAVAAILAGFSLGIMRQQTTSSYAGLPEFNFKNLLKFLTDGTIALGLKTGITVGLAVAGGMLGGIPGAVLGFIYSQLALAHYAASEETLRSADTQDERLSRGIKALSSVVDVRTIVGTVFAKPLNTIAALLATIGVASAAGAASSAAPMLAALASVIALVTNAHVWSKVYRSANCASDCEHIS